MKKSHELLSAVSLTAVMALGATACGAESGPPTPYSVTMQSMAQTILNRYNQAPSWQRYTGKLMSPYVAGVEVPLKNGEIALRMDSMTGKPNGVPTAGEVVEIDIDITENGRKPSYFSKTFVLLSDGTWNAYDIQPGGSNKAINSSTDPTDFEKVVEKAQILLQTPVGRPVPALAVPSIGIV